MILVISNLIILDFELQIFNITSINPLYKFITYIIYKFIIKRFINKTQSLQRHNY